MYKCKICGQENENTEMYCINCGEYIGEPMQEKKAFFIEVLQVETENKINKVGIIENNKKEKSFLNKKIDVIFRYVNMLKTCIINPKSSLKEDITNKSLFTLFISFALINSLLALLIDKYVIKSSSGILKKFILITPVKWNVYSLMNIDLSYIETFFHVIVLYVGGTVLLFCSTYLIMYYLFKKDVALLSIVKVIVVSSFWITLSLIGVLVFSILGSVFVDIIFFIVIIQYFLVFIEGIRITSGVEIHKVGYLSAFSHIILLAGMYLYIMAFMK